MDEKMTRDILVDPLGPSSLCHVLFECPQIIFKSLQTEIFPQTPTASKLRTPGMDYLLRYLTMVLYWALIKYNLYNL